LLRKSRRLGEGKLLLLLWVEGKLLLLLWVKGKLLLLLLEGKLLLLLWEGKLLLLLWEGKLLLLWVEGELLLLWVECQLLRRKDSIVLWVEGCSGVLNWEGVLDGWCLGLNWSRWECGGGSWRLSDGGGGGLLDGFDVLVVVEGWLVVNVWLGRNVNVDIRDSWRRVVWVVGIGVLDASLLQGNGRTLGSLVEGSGKCNLSLLDFWGVSKELWSGGSSANQAEDGVLWHTTCRRGVRCFEYVPQREKPGQEVVVKIPVKWRRCHLFHQTHAAGAHAQ